MAFVLTVDCGIIISKCNTLLYSQLPVIMNIDIVIVVHDDVGNCDIEKNQLVEECNKKPILPLCF